MTSNRLSLRGLCTSLTLSFSLLFASAPTTTAAQLMTPAQKAASAAQAAQVLAERGIAYASRDEIELLRTELLSVLTEFHDVEQIIGVRDRDGSLLQAPDDPGPSLSMIPDQMELVSGMTDAELTLLLEALPSLTELHRSSRELRIAMQVDLDRSTPTGSLGHQAPGTTPPGTERGGDGGPRGGLPNASYGCSGGRPSYANTVAAFSTVQVARAVAAVASRGCEQTAFGFNGSAVCIITDSILIAAEGVYAGIGLCTGDADSAEIFASYLRNGVLFDRSNTILNQTGTLLGQNQVLLNVLNDIQAAIGSSGGNAEILDNLASLRAFVGSNFGGLFSALNNVKNDVLAGQSGVVAVTVSRIDAAESDLLAAFQNQGGGLEARLDAIEDALRDNVEQKRLKMQALNISDGLSIMVVATEANLDNVDIVFDAVEVYESKSGTFNPVVNYGLFRVEAGVYQVTIPFTTKGNIFRAKGRREELPSQSGSGDLLGSVYWHRDALNSGGQ